MKATTLSVCLLTAVFLTSCDKSTDINLITPTQGQSYHSGDIVDVKAKFYDPDNLSGVDLTAISETGDTIYRHRVQVSNTQSYTLIDNFQVTRAGICTVRLDAWGGYGGSKSVTINVE